MYIVLVVIKLWIKSDPGNIKNSVQIKKADTLFGCNKSCTVNLGSCFKLQPLWLFRTEEYSFLCLAQLFCHRNNPVYIENQLTFLVSSTELLLYLPEIRIQESKGYMDLQTFCSSKAGIKPKISKTISEGNYLFLSLFY